MHRRAFVAAIFAAVVVWQFSLVAGEARCSYLASYPSAIGPHTFMLATATAGTVTAPIDTSFSYLEQKVPAQVMAIQDVAGYRAEAIRSGLRASGSTAVFVRYLIGASCGPLPAPDGALDSVGVNGLYVGRPRPVDRWIDGRPTFDILRSPHFPLPQRLTGPSGHPVFTMRVVGAPIERDTMTAAELFAMYRALWAESVSVGDTSVERRIRRWLEASPQTARKPPAKEVAMGMLSATTDALIAAHPTPFGGTFAITVVVPGVDSVLMYGQTSYRTRLWTTEVVRDSATGVRWRWSRSPLRST